MNTEGKIGICPLFPLKPFKKAKLEAILADFAATGLYEDDFMKDLEEGLKKSLLTLSQVQVVP